MTELPIIERYGCAVCGRTKTIRMGDRGPIKEHLERREIGNFLFCIECLADSTEYDERRDDLDLHIVRINSGEWGGQRWITSADYVRG